MSTAAFGCDLVRTIQDYLRRALVRPNLSSNLDCLSLVLADVTEVACLSRKDNGSKRVVRISSADVKKDCPFARLIDLIDLSDNGPILSNMVSGFCC